MTRSVLRTREALLGWLYVSPTAAIVIALFLLPLGMTFWMSAHDWPLLGQNRTFNFPENYAAIADDGLFWQSVGFTLVYTLVVVVALLVLAVGLALFVQPKRRGVGAIRTAFFLPAAVGLSSAALLFYSLYNNDYGPLDDILRTIGLASGDVNWLGSPSSAFWSTVILVLWRFSGFSMLIILSGLQSIPDEVYEASRTDGANWWQTFWHITLPLLRPSIVLLLVLNVSQSLLAFEPFYVLTGGGPENSTMTMVMVMVRRAFVQFDLGASAAIAVGLLLALVAINVAQLAVNRRLERS